MIRSPVVAGQFYPARAAQVESDLNQFLHPVPQKRHAIAVVAPHAGWTYSGLTAGKVYEQINVPDRVILVGPNHRGVGIDYALCDAGQWQTPLGDVPICEPLAAELQDRCDLFGADANAHAFEHSLEVQLPMLQRLNPRLQIVPIIIGGGWPWSGGRGNLRLIGTAIAEVVANYGQPVLLVASTDLNHYEDQETALVKDKLVLDAVVALDEDGLMQRVIEVDVSMCGVAATYVVLVAAKRLGATHAELIDHRTSGDVTGDFTSVVGYGAVAIW